MGQMRNAGDRVGDYRLVEAVSEGALTQTWRAEQISVQREVMLEMLKSEAAHDEAYKQAFVADIRAKAAVVHPVIGAVYEAKSGDDGSTFYAREKLSGETLEQWLEEDKKLTPRELVELLEQIGSAQRYLEKRKVATVPLAAHHIVIEDGVVRMVNLVADGPRDEDQSTRDKQLLGAIFDEMLLPLLPGSTRVGSLLAYMADLDREIPLTWKQIRDLSRQVIDQFKGVNQQEESHAAEEVAQSRGKIPSWVWGLVVGLAAIAGVFLVLLSREDQDEEPPEEDEVVLAPIEIVEGKSLSVHEVTIGQYARFLDNLALLPESDWKVFDHEDQPVEKVNHQPDDWHALLAAAQSGGKWNGRLVSENCPVVGVDWWDAVAYGNWEGSRLPTMREWTEASGPTASISGWGTASTSEKDRTERGLIGMAGNVREWTLNHEVNPANQLSPKAPVACGGSFANPSSGVRARTWLKNRSTRADDLGFRTLFEE